MFISACTFGYRVLIVVQLPFADSLTSCLCLFFSTSSIGVKSSCDVINVLWTKISNTWESFFVCLMVWPVLQNLIIMVGILAKLDWILKQLQKIWFYSEKYYQKAALPWKTHFCQAQCTTAYSCAVLLCFV